MRHCTWIFVVAAACLTADCSHEPRRFPLAPPFWEDPDQTHMSERPSEYYSGMRGDALDQNVFRRLSQPFAFQLTDEAMNVNAVDEVPNSSWFHNRIGLHPISPEEAARGACTSPPLDPTRGPWVVSAAKPDGATPGFFVKTPQGTYLLKFDGHDQPQRISAADAIGSRFYLAAGYHVPCNEVVYFNREVLQIGKGAKATSDTGKQERLQERHVDQVLDKAFRLKNGLIRAGASRFLPGQPLGPYKYEGTRADDPNDVIPHQDRRELRGHRLLAAWLGHIDSREQNSLDVWVEEGGRRFVRHYKIDLGDCFGSLSELARAGHTYSVDYYDMLVDFVSLGAMPRPWYRARINLDAELFGYFSSRDFVGSAWKPTYPNPAMERMTFRDALWMLRIISRFTDEHIREIVKVGRFTNPSHEHYLAQVLIERRDRILAEYLTQYAPLDRFRIVRRQSGSPVQSLCFEDLAVKHRLVDPHRVLYKLRFFGGERLKRQLGWLQFAPDREHAHRSCVQLPIGDRRPADLVSETTPDDHPLRYGVMKIYIYQKPTRPPTSSMWLHLYDLGRSRGYYLVGIERQPKPVSPD
jgi:hypothetical protein